MSNPITPTVGRIVYVGSPHCDHEVAAIVTEVVDNETLKVSAFLPDSTPLPMTVQYSAGGEAGTWQWTPYQLAAAGIVASKDAQADGGLAEGMLTEPVAETAPVDPTQPVEGAALAGASEAEASEASA